MKNQRGSSPAGVLGMIALIIGMFVGIWAITSWEKVPAGYVGVHVYLLGGEKGVDAVTRPVGRHWVGWQQEMYLYPVYTQNVEWSATDKGDRSISFSDADGTSISADIGMSYNVDPTKAAGLFQEFRKPIEDITDGQIRQRVIDALNAEAGQLKVDDVYGRGREALLARVQERVQKQLEPKGIRVEKLSWLGPPRLPAKVRDALNAKIEATQIANRRENEVQATIAEAEKAREEARGIADSTLLRATAEAEAIRIRGEALRQNPALVDLTIAEKWDGKLPEQYLGGSSDGKILQIMKK